MADAVTVDMQAGIAWVTIDNPPVNATSRAVRAGLLAAVAEVQGCRLAVLRAAGKTFVAGGDMSEFDAPPQPPDLPDVAAALDHSATPFLALLHGTVLGGGFEVAMACAFRIARPGTRFGLPEVNIGLIPGAGGTQRAPRLLGWDMAFEMASLGALKTAEELLQIGALDAVTEAPEALIAAWDRPVPVPVSRRLVPQPAPDRLDWFETRAKAAAKGRAAPMHALTALTWSAAPFSEGQPKERALHLRLRASAESRALRHLFFAERAAAKPAALAGVAARDIARVALVGGGLMGCGIAAAALNAGLTVTVIERDAAAAEAAQARIDALLKQGLARGKMTAEGYAARIAALTTAASLDAAAGAEIAIEAVFEDLAAKRRVLSGLAEVTAPGTLLATNTSYLDPDEIFDGLAHPSRCLGLHFFSPAHIMKLVEVIRVTGTAPETLATAFRLVRRLGKAPVLAGNCTGFIGNRMLAAYRRAAEYILADGALPHEVDAAMRAFGMAMGPFEAQDMAGLQIAEAHRRRQDATRDPAERYIPLADRLCARGRYGRSSGAGWYLYPEGTRPQRDPEVERLIAAYAAEAGLTRRAFADDEIQAQLLAAMANEGAAIVEEGIAETAATVDVVKTLGFGFPRWRGGPMHWAAQADPAELRAALSALETASPGAWHRAKRFAAPETE